MFGTICLSMYVLMLSWERGKGMHENRVTANSLQATRLRRMGLGGGLFFFTSGDTGTMRLVVRPKKGSQDERAYDNACNRGGEGSNRESD